MIDLPPPDPADVAALVLWQEVQAARLIYESHPTDGNLEHLRAHLAAFTQVFLGQAVVN